MMSTFIKSQIGLFFHAASNQLEDSILPITPRKAARSIHSSLDCNASMTDDENSPQSDEKSLQPFSRRNSCNLLETMLEDDKENDRNSFDETLGNSRHRKSFKQSLECKVQTCDNDEDGKNISVRTKRTNSILKNALEYNPTSAKNVNQEAPVLPNARLSTLKSSIDRRVSTANIHDSRDSDNSRDSDDTDENFTNATLTKLTSLKSSIDRRVSTLSSNHSGDSGDSSDNDDEDNDSSICKNTRLTSLKSSLDRRVSTGNHHNEVNFQSLSLNGLDALLVDETAVNDEISFNQNNRLSNLKSSLDRRVPSTGGLKCQESDDYLSFTPSTPGGILSKSMGNKSNHGRKVKFSKELRLLEIPSRQELMKIKTELWWTLREYDSFRREGNAEMKKFVHSNKCSVAEGRRLLYSESEQDLLSKCVEKKLEDIIQIPRSPTSLKID